ncbi:HAD family hydrolase [bacterium AH-315-I18]|nr:HAD family hydrolase [Phycisphaeraceae bacterium]MBN4061113.1 HAD family hydrolase [bacterium AH-315-I18]
MSLKRPAIFLDRDGTIIKQVHHLVDPEFVELLPGAADAINLFRDAGYACVVITNQSVIGRGMLTEAGLKAINQRMFAQLAKQGAKLDGLYFCPIAPAKKGDRQAIEHPDRKPGPGMLLRAAMEMNLDLSRSWMIGDMASDVLAGKNAQCKGSVLLLSGNATEADFEHADFVEPTLVGAAQLILNNESCMSAVEGNKR